MRPARFCLLLACLAVPVGARAEEAADLTFPGLARKIREVAQDLKALEDRLRPSERRLAEMEDQVRRMRLKVDTMEVQLKAIDESLKMLRKEVAALAGRTEAIEAKGPTPPQKATTPKGTPIPEGIAAIRSQKVSILPDLITISGVVVNKSDKPLVFVIVEAAFLDKDGNEVKTDAAYTEPRIVPADSTATFTIRTPGDPRIKDHRLSLRTE